MSSEDVINGADLFLREVPNVKIGKPVKSIPTAPKAKEELQVLRLSLKAQENIMETLKFIHGEDYSLDDASSYVDKGSSLGNKYWVGRGNLVIKGCYDYSNSNKEPDSEVERLKMFAAMRLESYGFHKEHCQEALDFCNGEVEDSLGLLYEKYLKLKPNVGQDVPELSQEELLEHRLDEKSVLESIYEDAFKEKVKDSVWIITLKLDYLVNLYHKNKPAKNQSNANTKNNVRKKEKCRFFLRNQKCKYGNNCRFSHEDDSITPGNSPNDHLTNFKFELEIRFPKDTKYPYETPIIFLKTDAVVPHQIPLHICKRLHQEAMLSAQDGMPCVYSVCELLKNEEEITHYLKTVEMDFLLPHESLFPKTTEDTNRRNRPTHYKKGATNRDNKREYSMTEIIKEDRRIQQQFYTKQTNAAYKKMQTVRNNLPAANFKETILETLQGAQVIVISGETGCGKSTQVPQFILDDWLGSKEEDNFKHVEIVCTQPRRISAIGVAERVADERVEKVGNTIGYQIRLENKISSSTRLTFCTTGILLRRLEVDPLLSTVTHIVVDEVHERSEDSDFLLLILRDLLPLRKDLKVILMSATLNANIFSDYFGNVPVLEIPGRTHPVDQIFLEDILEITNYVFDESSQYARSVKDKNIEQDLLNGEVSRIHTKPKNVVKDENLKYSEMLARYSDCSPKTCRTLHLMDPEKVNLDLIEAVLLWIVSGDHDHPKYGSILVFLPGIAEITALHDQLSCHPEFSPKYKRYMLVPLHSSLSSQEQAMVFEKPKDPAMRKIVLSTNIAETSITIDDCIFVVDSGKRKEKHFDSNRNMESLETVWVTRANALQRKGRAGRVTSGICIHLYTSHRYTYNILGQPIPEIHRVPLERLVLNIKVLPNFSERDVHDVLVKTIEPPVRESIDSSIIRLQSVGALDRDNNLTPLGHHLAALPVDVRIGKLMLFGAIFSCIDSALTMAACLSYKTPFVAPFGQREKANKARQKFAMGMSDQMTVLLAYNKFQEANKKGYFAGLNFAKENYLSHRTLLTISDVKFQFLELLVSIGFIPINITKRPKSGQDNILALTGAKFNEYGSNTRILSSILCAALYPNVCKVLQPEKTFVSSAAGAVPKQLEAKDFKFKTRQEQVFLHPSSIVFELKYFPSPFMVYQEKVKTSKIFIRDCCVIPAIPLVLFSGFDVNINIHNGITYLELDDKWIMFEAEEHKVAEMIKTIRVELLDLLEEKIKDPLLNLQNNAKGERVIGTILQMVTGE